MTSNQIMDGVRSIVGRDRLYAHWVIDCMDSPADVAPFHVNVHVRLMWWMWFGLGIGHLAIRRRIRKWLDQEGAAGIVYTVSVR